jgi:hypothetical protein
MPADAPDLEAPVQTKPPLPALSPSTDLELKQRLLQAGSTQPLAEPAPRKPLLPLSRGEYHRRDPKADPTAHSVGLPVPPRAKSAGAPVPLTVNDIGKPVAEIPPPADVDPSAKDSGATKRRDRRAASRTPATLWREGMSQAMSCTIRDKSASGAMLEFAPSKFGDASAVVQVGDKFTLTIQVSRESTSVACQVVRVDGRRCGVKFCGQFHTQIQKPRKSLKV